MMRNWKGILLGLSVFVLLMLAISPFVLGWLTHWRLTRAHQWRGGEKVDPQPDSMVAEIEWDPVVNSDDMIPLRVRCLLPPQEQYSPQVEKSGHALNYKTIRLQRYGAPEDITSVVVDCSDIGDEVKGGLLLNRQKEVIGPGILLEWAWGHVPYGPGRKVVTVVIGITVGSDAPLIAVWQQNLEVHVLTSAGLQPQMQAQVELARTWVGIPSLGGLLTSIGAMLLDRLRTSQSTR